MDDTYKEEKQRQGVSDSVVDYYGPDNVNNRMQDMREAARRLKNKSAPKSEPGKSPYLDTQLLQQDLVGKYERMHRKTKPKNS